MMSILLSYQVHILWAIIGCYLIAWLPIMFGGIFDRPQWLPKGIALTIAGLLFHILWIGLRWKETGHGPYLNLYEVASSDSIIAIIIYLLAQWKYPKLKICGIIVLPIVILLLGFGALSTKDPVTSSPILDSYWLVVHVLTAKLAFGSYLISFALAVAFILEERHPHLRILAWFPRQPVTEELIRKFISLGFLNHSVMLVSGSIWANVAFGSYWSWDAIETWALIAWIIYGIFFHLVTIHGWKGEKMAWMSITAMVSMVFALFGVPLVFDSAHNLFF